MVFPNRALYEHDAGSDMIAQTDSRRNDTARDEGSDIGTHTRCPRGVFPQSIVELDRSLRDAT